MHWNVYFMMSAAKCLPRVCDHLRRGVSQPCTVDSLGQGGPCCKGRSGAFLGLGRYSQPPPTKCQYNHCRAQGGLEASCAVPIESLYFDFLTWTDISISMFLLWSSMMSLSLSFYAVSLVFLLSFLGASALPLANPHGLGSPGPPFLPSFFMDSRSS